MTAEQVPDTSTDQSPGGVRGDSFPRDAIDATEAPRQHMREMAVARKATERRGDGSATPFEGIDHVAQMHTDLARIEAEHQAWLRYQGEDD